ncbi:MAG TPA: hypothetical protein VFY49_00175 [Myxococcota bacterium]|nr:hypothetical protein [Myxococcota bacterium]
MHTRRTLIALSILLLAAALPGSARAALDCQCENGEVVQSMGDDPADCDDACADLAGSRAVDRGDPNGRESSDQSPTTRDPDDNPGPNRKP